jgi:hypothetical protein
MQFLHERPAFYGDLFRLPNRHVLSLTTMCGQGMISAGFARKLIEQVKDGMRGE